MNNLQKSFAIFVLLMYGVGAEAQTLSGPRQWQSQEGRTITATFLKLEGDQVTLQLDTGAVATLSISRLSGADQMFLRQQSQSPKGSESPTVRADSQTAKKLEWPGIVTVDKKNLQIVTGEQDETARRFVYRSGSFQFVCQAPLTPVVMREIAADFELTMNLYKQLPWGWQPKPRNGSPFFLANLHETEADFVAGGGLDNSSGGSKDDFVFAKFSGLGLKKVGARYAFDSKTKQDGSMVSLINRLVMGDMTYITMPWASRGIEDFLERVAYRNGSFVFANPERALKERLEAVRKSSYEYKTDVDRMIAMLRKTWREQQVDNSAALRTEAFTDGLLLFYYFGFLDDDGKGARLHHYFSTVAKDQLEVRRFNDSGRTGTPPSWSGTFEDHAKELNEKIIIGGRPDEKLKELLLEKFRSVGIKL